MDKFKRLFTLLLIGLTLFMVACSDKSKDEDSSSTAPPDDGVPGPGEPGAPATPPTVSASGPLAIKMSTKFDTTDYSYNLTFVETGTDTCSATTTAPVATCTVEVPEGRLYFSSLTLAYSYLPSNCRIMTFQPYYYRASVTDGYLPPDMVAAGGEGLKCSGAADPAPSGCWGGAAPLLVPGFPAFSALIHLPDESDTSVPVGITKTIDSAYSKAYGSNRHTVNDMTVANQSSAHSIAALGNIGDGYIANSYVDYQFSCRDDWADPQTFILNLKVKDVDTSGGGANHMLTWKELP